MFRATTKHDVRSQEHLKKTAWKSMDESVPCNSIYDTTYGKPLPQCAISILSKVTLGLTGNTSMPCSSSRVVHIVCRYRLSDDRILSVVFIQPELVSCTAHVPHSEWELLLLCQRILVSEPNMPKPGRVRKLNTAVEVSGRLAPYIVDMADVGSDSTWTYCNITRSRFLVLITSRMGQQTYGLTKQSLKLLKSYCDKSAVFMDVAPLYHFSLNTSPRVGAGSSVLGNNTALILYYDGSLRVNGKPSVAHTLCKVFRESLIKVIESTELSSLLLTLDPIKDHTMS